MLKPNRKYLLAYFILGILSSAPARAKVVFTGYGDFEATGQALFDVNGPAPVLNSFGIGGPEQLEDRGFSVNSLGLFATTDISDNTRAQLDFTYRGLGSNGGNTDIEYAYIESDMFDSQFQAGKITLPFGYYNQNRFYPFERASITGPFYQSLILGLPMADLGADAQKTVDLGAVSLKADAYAVNGFGPTPGSTDTFRDPSLPGGISITNNISGQDLNHRVAWGTRLELGSQAASEDVIGASYYRDQWNPAGSGVFQMVGAHIHALYDGFDFLTEYLFLSVTQDYGMVSNFGSTSWTTNGFFTEVDYKNLSLWRKPTTPWVRVEDYKSQGNGGGFENLWAYAGGVSVQLMPQLAFKLEGDDIYYQLPYQNLGYLSLRGYIFSSDLVFTF